MTESQPNVLTQFARQREAQWLDGRLPLPPVDLMPEWLIPQSKHVCGDEIVLKEINEAVKTMDIGWVILYDPLTTDNGVTPGYHLYRRHNGILNLEFSLQYDTTLEWPEGGPRMPGWWVVEHLKSTDKAKEQGDEQRINHAWATEKVRRSKMAYLASEKSLAEESEFLWREVIDPYWNKKRFSKSVDPYWSSQRTWNKRTPWR